MTGHEAVLSTAMSNDENRPGVEVPNVADLVGEILKQQSAPATTPLRKPLAAKHINTPVPSAADLVGEILKKQSTPVEAVEAPAAAREVATAPAVDATNVEDIVARIMAEEKAKPTMMSADIAPVDMDYFSSATPVKPEPVAAVATTEPACPIISPIKTTARDEDVVKVPSLYQVMSKGRHYAEDGCLSHPHLLSVTLARSPANNLVAFECISHETSTFLCP